ncbi:MAG: hypothetical protein M3O33_04885 [Cyanobacteriota bacterium]|nr:hypothetical protein [Cyanobacteriota bacterium]
MIRKLTILLMSLSLCWTTFACSSPDSTQAYRNPNNNTSSTPSRTTSTRLSDGQYSVQQATYDDINGEYSLMLLDTPPGTPSVFSTTDLQMARLTDEEIKAGKKSYLSMNGGKAALHLTEDFKIEYVHNVTENQTNPQTGQQETVVVRQQSGFWAPFAGAIAGQALGSLLFAPRYYVPPVYQPGVVLTGYGGYGNTYSQAVNRYQTRYQSPPPAVKNRQTFRTTGRLNSRSSSQPATVRRTPSNSSRSTGSGYGSSKLRQSNKSYSTRTKRPSSFGSGGQSRRPSSFGTKRR